MLGTSKVSVLLSLILGLLLGAVLLVFGAYFSGFLDWDNDQSDQTVSLTQGTDWLEDYSCAKGETKQLIIRGVEDNYSPDGEELVPESDYANSIITRSNNNFGHRHYDDPEPDKILFETFDIPSQFAHGIFVIRLREHSIVKNDAIRIGNLQLIENGQYISAFDHVAIFINKLSQLDYWEHKNDIYRVNFKNLEIQKPSAPETITSVADYIHHSATPLQQISVAIEEDTQVDFMGLALCLGPEEDMGMVYALRDWDYYGRTPEFNEDTIPKDYRAIDVAIIDSKPCHIYTGCYNCEKALPLACFEYQDLSISELTPTLNHISSRGEVRLTKPVAGNQFGTADDVHKFCRLSFGDKWRALSRHEASPNGQMLTKLRNPLNSSPFWIDVKGNNGGQHSNCWAQRPEPTQ